MATQVQTSRYRMTPLVSQQTQVLRRFGSAMRSHQLDLRLSINHIETIVGCIAKSADAEVIQHLPQSNLAISNLRECLSKLQIQWSMFENWQEHHNNAGNPAESDAGCPKEPSREE
jgi:hypothetical protein